MTFIFMVTTFVMTILTFSYWHKQKQIENIYSYQEVCAESWALPSQIQGGVFIPSLLDEHLMKEGIQPKNPFIEPVMSYQSEDIFDNEVEEFYRLLSTQGPTEFMEYEHEPEPKPDVKYETKEMVCNEDFYYAVRGQIDEAVANMEPIQPFYQYEPTLLSSADWENTEEDNTVLIDPSFMELADCRIADGLLGFQAWVCMIVGKEQEYLHIADGTARTWINVENFKDKKFSNGDILFIELERNDDGLSVQTLNILQRSFDGEFENTTRVEYDEQYNYLYDETEMYVS